MLTDMIAADVAERTGVVSTDKGRYTVDDVVRRLGVTPRTLHYYEEVGLIAPFGRTGGGHRLYDDEVIARLSHILRLKDILGYSLQEIRLVLEAEEQLDRLKITYRSDLSDDARSMVLDESARLLDNIVGTINDKIDKLEAMKSAFEERLARVRLLRDN